MKNNKHIEHLIASFKQRRPIRAGSLIITVYGDAIAPRGGTVWMGSLIKILEPLGLNQRLVRTSVSRLVKENWLTAEQVGRRSYYSLTTHGRRLFENATRRIYAGHPHEWDNTWTVVIMPSGELANRERIRKELAWLGFGVFATGIMAHPQPDTEALSTTLEELGIRDQVIVMQASEARVSAQAPLRRVVNDCWKLDELGASYSLFVKHFRPILQTFQDAKSMDPAQCMQVRTLLIHEYRRILLRDPQLPLPLLPEHWSGAAAHDLCHDVYSAIHRTADEYLSEFAETADGPLPPPAPYFNQRFGGL